MILKRIRCSFIATSSIKLFDAMNLYPLDRLLQVLMPKLRILVLKSKTRQDMVLRMQETEMVNQTTIRMLPCEIVTETAEAIKSHEETSIAVQITPQMHVRTAPALETPEVSEICPSV